MVHTLLCKFKIFFIAKFFCIKPIISVSTANFHDQDEVINCKQTRKLYTFVFLLKLNM